MVSKAIIDYKELPEAHTLSSLRSVWDFQSDGTGNFTSQYNPKHTEMREKIQGVPKKVYTFLRKEKKLSIVILNIYR